MRTFRFHLAVGAAGWLTQSRSTIPYSINCAKRWSDIADRSRRIREGFTHPPSTSRWSWRRLSSSFNKCSRYGAQPTMAISYQSALSGTLTAVTTTPRTPRHRACFTTIRVVREGSRFHRRTASTERASAEGRVNYVADERAADQRIHVTTPETAAAGLQSVLAELCGTRETMAGCATKADLETLETTLRGEMAECEMRLIK